MTQIVLKRNTCRNMLTLFSRAKGGNFFVKNNINIRAIRAFSHETNPLVCNCRALYSREFCLVKNTEQLSLIKKTFSSASNNIFHNDRKNYIDTTDSAVYSALSKDMQVIEDFITEEEEENMLHEIEPYLKRLKYQSSHWDDAIHEYRETERRKWSEKNATIIQRIRDAAFPPDVSQLSYVHVLDLKKEGQIKPHVDAVRFCGNTIAGISLLSSSVMRLVNTEDKTKMADILLKQRSLYIMKDKARYKYTHEILHEKDSYFQGNAVPRNRRISVICRNEPET